MAQVSYGAITITDISDTQTQLNALTARIKKIWTNENGSYIASGIRKNGVDIDIDTNDSNTYGYNVVTRPSSIDLNYNAQSIIQLDGAESALKFFQPPTIDTTTDPYTVVQGGLAMKLDRNALSFLNPANGDEVVKLINGANGSSLTLGSEDTTTNVFNIKITDTAINDKGPGILFRKGLTVLGEFKSDKLNLYSPDDSTIPVAQFGANLTQLGSNKTGHAFIQLLNNNTKNGLEIYSAHSTSVPIVRFLTGGNMGSTSITVNEVDDYGRPIYQTYAPYLNRSTGQNFIFTNIPTMADVSKSILPHVRLTLQPTTNNNLYVFEGDLERVNNSNVYTKVLSSTGGQEVVLQNVGFTYTQNNNNNTLEIELTNLVDAAANTLSHNISSNSVDAYGFSTNFWGLDVPAPSGNTGSNTTSSTNDEGADDGSTIPVEPAGYINTITMQAQPFGNTKTFTVRTPAIKDSGGNDAILATFIVGNAETITYTMPNSNVQLRFVYATTPNYKITASVYVGQLSDNLPLYVSNWPTKDVQFYELEISQVLSEPSINSAIGSRIGTAGNFNTVIGLGLKGTTDYQTVVGKYNKDVSGPFVVGNGLSQSNTSNAFAIDWDGQVKLKNGLTTIFNSLYNNTNNTYYYTDGYHAFYATNTAGSTKQGILYITGNSIDVTTSTNTSYWSARDGARIKLSKASSAQSAYSPMISMQGYAGNWAIAKYQNDELCFNYINDKFYRTKSNPSPVYRIRFQTNGDIYTSGSIYLKDGKTHIYNGDANNTDNTYYITQGYHAFYVASSRNATPTGIAYLHPDYINFKAPVRVPTFGGSWVDARDKASIRRASDPSTESYYPILSFDDNTNSDWSIGTLGTSLYFSRVKYSDYESGTNQHNWVYITSAGALVTENSITSGGALTSQSIITSGSNIRLPNAISLQGNNTSGTPKALIMMTSGNQVMISSSDNVANNYNTLIYGKEIHLQNRVLLNETPKGGSWYQSRDYAAIRRETNASNASAYYPIISFDDTNGSDWSIGTIGTSLYFSRVANNDYTSKTNNHEYISIDLNGNLTTSGGLTVNNNITMPNGIYFNFKNSSGTAQNMIILNSSNQFYIGNTGYDTYLRGKYLSLSSGGDIYLNPSSEIGIPFGKHIDISRGDTTCTCDIYAGSYNATRNIYYNVSRSDSYHSFRVGGAGIFYIYNDRIAMQQRLSIGGTLNVSGNTTVSGNLTATGTTSSQYLKRTATTKSSSSVANVRITEDGSILPVSTWSSSSARYKEAIDKITEPEIDPKHLYDIEVVQFKYTADMLDNPEDMRTNRLLPGFIAEQVYEVYPVAVDVENGRPETWSDRYIIPPMLALIQEQKKEIDELKEKVQILEDKYNE